MDRSLWFLAILPDEAIQEEVEALKQYAARHFQTKRALRAPAHITLIPPFFWSVGELDLLRQALADFSVARSSFSMQLSGFDCFAPRVIFIHPTPSDDLTELQAALARLWVEELKGTPEERPYHPHLTVAFKDLRRSVFPAAWAYFREQTYERTFQVAGFWLLLHQDHRWQPFHFFPFGKGGKAGHADDPGGTTKALLNEK